MSPSILPSLLLPLAAVSIGFAIALVFKPKVTASVRLLLSFSGAFLLAITVFDFFPEVFKNGDSYVGTKFPVLLFFSLCAHSFIEGFPLADNQELLYGVVVHKIPIAIIISAFILNAQLSRMKIFLFLVGFAMMTPLGAFAKAYIPILQQYSIYLNAFAVGVLLHVATTILFESSKNHQFNASKFMAIILGIVLAYFI